MLIFYNVIINTILFLSLLSCLSIGNVVVTILRFSIVSLSSKNHIMISDAQIVLRSDGELFHVGYGLVDFYTMNDNFSTTIGSPGDSTR